MHKVRITRSQWERIGKDIGWFKKETVNLAMVDGIVVKMGQKMNLAPVGPATSANQALPIMRQITNLFPALKDFLTDSVKRNWLLQILEGLSRDPSKIPQLKNSLMQLQQLEEQSQASQTIDEAAQQI